MGQSTSSPDQTRAHAVVIGSSVAGLLAASALASHYQRVTVLERDPEPQRSEPRRGVPQGTQPHLLLAAGLQALDELLPHLSLDLIAAGGLVSDPAWNTCWYQDGGYKARAHSGIRSILASRPLIEGVIRSRVSALPNVHIRYDSRVEGLVYQREAVRGVQVGQAGQDFPVKLAADLVVDASGRGSRVLAWLERLGYDLPPETKVQVDIVYTTQVLQDPSAHDPDDSPPEITTYAILDDHSGGKRAGAAIRVEQGRWMVLLAGMLGEKAPTDRAGFLRYAQSFSAPELADLLGRFEAVTEPTSYRFSGSQRRHYERLREFPPGLLVLGDALCSFNPLYGQGMTVAALQAQHLRACGRLPGDTLWKAFFRGASQTIDTPWNMVVGRDLSRPEVQGKRPFLHGFSQWYARQIHLAGQVDGEVACAFYRVSNLLASPLTLFAPSVIRRVYAAQHRRKPGPAPQFTAP